MLARAAAAGVARLIVTGTTLAASRAALALAVSHPGQLWATAGVHPHHAGEFTDDCERELRELLRHSAVVAAGECGLDYFRDIAPRAVQRTAFARQLQLGIEAGKPVFLHQREAHDDFVAMLREHAQALRGVTHCFTGGPGALQESLELGLHVGITGWICDERRSQDLREAVRELPLDRLLVETDAPYLLPRTLRPRPASRRNEPAWLPEVVRVLAGCMEVDEAEIVAASARNAEALFGLPAR